MTINKTTQYTTNPNVIPVDTSTGSQTLRESLDRRLPYFNSVADMIASTSLYVGAVVQTLGYYSPGDGGRNEYEIVAASTGAADGGSFIDLTGSGLQAKGLFAQETNVLQFGAKGDVVNDDTDAFKAAASRGGLIYLPEPPVGYLLTDTTDINNSGTVIRGSGDHCLIRLINGHNFDIFNANAFNILLENFRVVVSGTTGTTESFIVRSSSPSCFVRNVTANGVFSGFYSGAPKFYGNTIRLNSLKPSLGNGFVFDEPGEVRELHDILIESSEGSEFFSGITVKNGGGYSFSKVEIFKATFPVNMQAANGVLIGATTFTDVWFDTSTGDGLRLLTTGSGVIRRIRAVNCWFGSNNRGINIAGTVQLATFSACHVFDNAVNGVLINGSCQGLIFDGCTIVGNTDHGIRVEPGYGDFSVQGCRIGGMMGGFGPQDVGISIGAGVSDNFSITDCDLRGNTAISINDGSTGSNVIISDNLGYNTKTSGTATLASGTTSVVVNHSLADTPSISDIMVTRASGSAGSGDFWVSSPTSSSFTINVQTAPGANISFAWRASIKGS